MGDRRLIYGLHAVAAALKRRPGQVHEVYLDASRQDPRMRRIIDTARAAGVAVRNVDGARLAGFAGGGIHQGVVAFVDQPAPASSVEELLEALVEPPLLLVLDGVQDPHNLGACLRVADATGAHAVIVPKDRAVGLSPTVHKVASGAAESVPLIAVTNLAAQPTYTYIPPQTMAPSHRGQEIEPALSNFVKAASHVERESA